MGQVLVMGPTKGGVGKTTLTTEISTRAARDGLNTLLVEMDSLQHALSWAAMRHEKRSEGAGVPRLRAVELRAPQGAGGASAVSYILEELQAHQAAHDLVVVDVRGSDTLEFRVALQLADVVLCPILPSTFNAWGVTSLDLVLQQARPLNPDMLILGVLNQISTHPTAGPKEIREAREFLAEAFEREGYALAESALRFRGVYRKAREQGLNLGELRGTDRDQKADAEMEAVYQEVLHHVTHE